MDILGRISEIEPILSICGCCADGVRININKEGRYRVAPLVNPDQRLWRTDLKLGRNVYALLSNDVSNPSELDPLIGTMESSELAQDVVDTHNRAFTKYGRHYLKALSIDD